jgi:hypothetical protein
LILTAAVVLAVAALAVALLDPFIVVVSLFMVVVAVTTLAFQLYKWWRPEHNDPNRYGEPDEPRLPGVILVPMRHEEAVAGHTLERLANLDHPDYRVVPIIDHPDDPTTATVAHSKAGEYPDRVLVAPYPEDTDVHNKPTGLNAAMSMLRRTGIVFEWIGIADAEDLFHPRLLHMVDYRFRRTGAGIVQCGVQLMNFSAYPRSTPLPGGGAAAAAPLHPCQPLRLVARRQRARILQMVPVPPEAAGRDEGDAAGRQHRVLPPRLPRVAAWASSSSRRSPWCSPQRRWRCWGCSLSRSACSCAGCVRSPWRWPSSGWSWSATATCRSCMR